MSLTGVTGARRFYGDDEDRVAFLRTLEEACQRTGWRVHAYVLMSNHYHLMLETPEPNLVAGMRWFQATWTMRFNRCHHLRGHVLQGRYKAVIVDPGASGYFAALSDYIHLNPGNSLALFDSRFRRNSRRENQRRRRTRKARRFSRGG